jgi:hypothetical protein
MVRLTRSMGTRARQYGTPLLLDRTSVAAHYMSTSEFGSFMFSSAETKFLQESHARHRRCALPGISKPVTNSLYAGGRDIAYSLSLANFEAPTKTAPSCSAYGNDKAGISLSRPGVLLMHVDDTAPITVTGCLTSPALSCGWTRPAGLVLQIWLSTKPVVAPVTATLGASAVAVAVVAM